MRKIADTTESRLHYLSQTLPVLTDRLLLNADPPASVNLIYGSEILIAIRIFHAILLLLTEYDAMLHHIDCQFINTEKSVTCFFTEKQNYLFPHMTPLI